MNMGHSPNIGQSKKKLLLVQIYPKFFGMYMNVQYNSIFIWLTSF